MRHQPRDCTKYWKDICTKAEGSYVQIAQDGGVAAVATPYDKQLAEINREVACTTLTYGDRSMQAAGEAKKVAAGPGRTSRGGPRCVPGQGRPRGQL